MTIDLKIEGDAAAQLTELAKASGESVAEYVGDAVVTKRWVDDNVRAGRLYIMEPGGRLREVRPENK